MPSWVDRDFDLYGLDRNAPSISLSSDLSNIDNVVDQIKVIEGL
ncbi:MAG: hypothetical protein ACJATI_002688 [Halioglobus sp.]|jgi:hypothetical protein